MLIELATSSLETKISETIDPTKYIFLVKAISFKFNKRFKNNFERIEDSEVYSIASLELVKAAASYNPSVNEDFSRYAYRLMRNGIIQNIRYLNRQKRTAAFKDLTDSEWQELFEKRDQDAAIENISYQDLIADCPDDTTQDREDKSLLIEVYIKKEKISSVAKKLGISRVTVYSRIQRILKKIRHKYSNIIRTV